MSDYSDREEAKRERPNATWFRTESGNRVYVVGTTRKNNKPVRVRAGNAFVKVYNRNFTAREQREIGNIYYNITEPPDNKNFTADSSFERTKEWRKLNNNRQGIAVVRTAPDVRKDESVITHELIHVKTFTRHGYDQRKHNERKIDFEMVGRVSRKGLENMQHGYYWSHLGNQELRKGKYKGKRHEIIKRGIQHDRRLLTGSLNKSLIGKPVERKVNKLFKQSYFFKRSFEW